MKFLAMLLVAFVGVALLPGPRVAECHANHCHASKECGSWKYYRDNDAAEASAAGEVEACTLALTALEKKTVARAGELCLAKHKCGGCPDKCDGCVNERPFGRLGSEKKRTQTVTTSAAGKTCKVAGEVVFICRCSRCALKDKAKASK